MVKYSVEGSMSTVDATAGRSETAICRIGFAISNVEIAIASVETATCRLASATSSLQAVTSGFASAACRLQTATCSVETVTCSFAIATYRFAIATCCFAIAKGSTQSRLLRSQRVGRRAIAKAESRNRDGEVRRSRREASDRVGNVPNAKGEQRSRDFAPTSHDFEPASRVYERSHRDGHAAFAITNEEIAKAGSANRIPLSLAALALRAGDSQDVATTQLIIGAAAVK
jgi:hypothetical protein